MWSSGHPTEAINMVEKVKKVYPEGQKKVSGKADNLGLVFSSKLNENE